MATRIQRSALLPYPAQALFDLVNDVAGYPQFLPWCRASEVLEVSETHMLASLEVAKGSIGQRFVTRNVLQPGQRIEMNLQEGPLPVSMASGSSRRWATRPARSAWTLPSTMLGRWCVPRWARCSIRRPIPWSTPSASEPSSYMDKPSIAIEVVYALAERQKLLRLSVPTGTTVRGPRCVLVCSSSFQSWI